MPNRLPDIEAMSRGELVRLRNQIDKAIDVRTQSDRAAAKSEIERIAREHGFGVHELVDAQRVGGMTPKPKTPRPIALQNPDDHSQTWSGRGRRPRWIANAIENGRDIEELLFKG